MKWNIGVLIVLCVLGAAVCGVFGQEAGPPAASDSGRRISMDFKEANLQDVLKAFSQQAGMNFIASEAVKDKKITLYLDGVSVKDALDSIIKANGLTYDQAPQSSIFLIRESGEPAVETVTRVFKLKYARVYKSKLIQTGTVRTGQAAAGSTSTGGGGTGTSTSGSTTGIQQGSTTSQSILTAEKKEETDIKSILEKFLTKNGFLVVDERTNSVIATDIPSQIEIIARIIEQLDTQTPQVMIEAQIYEVKWSTLLKLGVTWGTGASGRMASFTGTDRVTRFPFGHRLTKPGKSTASTVPSSGINLGILSTSELAAALDMLSSETGVEILARPKIMSVSNEPATINITADTAVGQTTLTFGEGASAGSTTGAERMTTGTSLTVVSQVNPDGYITLTIEPAVTRAVASSTFTTSPVFLDPETRSARTTVMVKNGETVVIGGLITRDVTRVERRVPILGDIPFLGLPFRHKSDQRETKELVIFLTPRVVTAETAAIATAGKMDFRYGQERMETVEREMDRDLKGLGRRHSREQDPL